jgi:hypothetical protein
MASRYRFRAQLRIERISERAYRKKSEFVYLVIRFIVGLIDHDGMFLSLTAGDRANAKLKSPALRH